MNIDDALPTFFAESAELLREMETDLLACTSATPSADDVNRIFRAAHTLKGSSGLFGFDAIVAFVHEMEACLDRVRCWIPRSPRCCSNVRIMSRNCWPWQPTATPRRITNCWPVPPRC